MTEFRRIAIVNRGEPAMRLINAARELREAGDDVVTIALHTAAEHRAMFVREADEAVCFEPTGAGAVNPYLDLGVLEHALVAARADAAWVGWGFVAERPEFAELCERLGITFIGPSPEVMRRLGDKIGAKRLAEAAGVPVAPWSGGPVDSLADARAAAERVGFPLMIKATSGGGGRGIRFVGGPDELATAFESARAEGLKAFGDATVFLERVVAPARHVEVQIIADRHGTVWAAGVRDCSVQRRNQKVIEESRSPALSETQERALGEAAVRLAKVAGYTNAGTVEFLYQPDAQAFAFLEVNTRLQVEHPVTEVTTGIDLVKLQLLVARGGQLDDAVGASFGHAIEARLNAEDPQRGFAPSPGVVDAMEIASGPGIRVDTGIAEGDVIPAEYDSMVAKVIAWGRTRDEARARLRRALAQSTVVIRGGTTNKAFLLQLLDRPELVHGDYDTGWLDRLTAAETPAPSSHAAAALLVAAIDVYDEEAQLERARFLGSASRGRPQLSPDLGHETTLQAGGATYRLHVAQAGPHGWYQVSLGDRRADVILERLGRSRSRLTLGERVFKVVSTAHGTDHRVEVEGEAHRFSRDDGGLVRAPAAAVVLAVLVEPGEVVERGRRIALLEAMKMEVAIVAPMAGRVADVLVAANMQVDAGTPLLRLEPLEAGDAPAAAPRVRLDDLADLSTPDSGGEILSLLGALRATVLGYDLSPGAAAEVLQRYDAVRARAPQPDAAVAHAELSILDAFADLCSLTRDRRQGEVDEGEVRSAREWFNVYLRSLDPEREGLPPRFVDRLARALHHYGVDDLERSSELEEALYRIAQAQQRRLTQVPIVRALLERLLAESRPDSPSADELQGTLDRLIAATQLRHPQVGDLARSVRYRCFDQPIIDRARAVTFAEMRDHLAHLRAAPESPDASARMDRLVACGQPLIRLLGDEPDEGHGGVEPLVEVLIRRYYKIRPLRVLGTQTVDGEHVLRAEYDHNDRTVGVLGARTTRRHLGRALGAIAAAAVDGDPTGRTVVDLYAVWDRPIDADELALDVLGQLATSVLPPNVRRVQLAAHHPDSSAVQQLTFRQGDDGFAEDRLFRGMHPMIARRLDLWRFENFRLTRLPSAEDVYLFDCVARDNPADERLSAVAEVRDFTPLRDEAGRITSLPQLEQVLGACLDSIRRARSEHPRLARLEWNRVMLLLWPVVDAPLDELQALATRLARLTEGLGLEQVAVRARIADPSGGEADDVVLRVGYQPGSGATLDITEPPQRPLQPLNDYAQRVLQARRRGLLYPYEVVSLLAGSGGTFVEHDLDDAGDLVPVSRPPGGNRAGVVVGVVTTPTTTYPEGMRRVAVLGDPTRAMGSIAEPECRRLLAAIDLAARQHLPIEWFAVSAGAKIAMDSGTENLDWVARVLRRLVEHTQTGGEVNVVVTGINVGAQPYWNAEATMLMHTTGILVMLPDSAMVLTGKQALDYSGGVSAEDNLGLGGYDRIMGPNGEAQYWARNPAAAVELLMAHYDHTYVVAGEAGPRRAATSDPVDRDVRGEPHVLAGSDFTTVGDIFSDTANRDRKKPFDIRTLMRAVIDHDLAPIERWEGMQDAEAAVVLDAHLGGYPVTLVGVESRPLPRFGPIPADGPAQWSAGTLFPLSSKKVARAINAASGNRPVVVLANLSGFDGSPESLRRLQLEYGAEIGRAIVNFDGTIVLCVVSRYHGGAFVVFSAMLNDRMQVLAVEGSFASVIGGAPAAAVVFTADVDRRTDADPRVIELEAELSAASGDERALLRTRLADVRAAVRMEKLGELAAEFDAVHSVERARAVGSVHRIIPAARLRPALVEAIERDRR